MQRRWKTAGWVLAGLYAVALVFTVADYGVTWDEPGWFRIGDRHLAFFKDLDARHIAPQPGPWGWEAYGPHAATVSAITADLAHEQFGWTSADTGRHLGNILFAVAASLFLWGLVNRRDGARVAFFALLAFATLPRWFGHAHNNPSDMPAATWLIGAFACVVGYAKTGRRGWILAAGAALGGAAAVRPQTAVFAPLVILGWIAIDLSLRTHLRRRPSDALLAVGAAAFTLFLLWPMLWTNPVAHGQHILDFFLNPPPWQGRGGLLYLGSHYTDSPPWHYPFVMTAVTTPLPVLVLAAWGILSAFLDQRGHRYRQQSVWLAVWWTFAAIGVHALMTRGNYDGVRHFLEAFGGLVWLAGIGASDIVERCGQWRARGGERQAGELLGACLCVVAFLPGLVGIARLHPYPQIYYNALVGGPRGAAELFEVEYWGFSWKPGMAWLEANAAPGALVITPWLEGVSSHYRRPDLEIAVSNQPGEIERHRREAGRSGREVYFLFLVRQGFIAGDTGVEPVRRRYPLVPEERAGDVALLEIYRLD